MAHSHPQRIVTLLPSATEIVCSLGLIEKLVGVTHECDYPPEVAQLPRVTASALPAGLASGDIDRRVRAQLEAGDALYTLDTDLLERLAPDLIVTQALCNVCAVSESVVLRAARRLSSKPAVINLEPMSLADVFNTMERTGDIAGIADHARQYVRALRARVDRVRDAASNVPLPRRPRVALLEWIDPPFNAGHWNPELIEIAGGIDCLGNANAPSRSISWTEINDANPDILIIALCGFTAERAQQDLPILKANLEWDRLACTTAGEVHVLDGNAGFSRSGPRLVDSLEQLGEIIGRATGSGLRRRP